MSENKTGRKDDEILLFYRRNSDAIRRRQHVCLLLVLLLGFLTKNGDAFVLHHVNRMPAPSSSSSSPLRNKRKRYITAPSDTSSSKLNAVDFAFFSNYIGPAPPATLESGVLSNYAPAATSLFNNMKLPAAVVTAGMISLGFATTFPELPKDGNFSNDIRARCESLRRLHILVALISVTSELIVVLWAAVEVNQLTERAIQPAASVWDLIQRDCDLAWSAVNSHFVLGIIGFCFMLAIRAYVMLLAAQASRNLISAAMSGTAAALCLMISIVNRGVESGGGEGVGYGSTILDLLQHYAFLLWSLATSVDSPGPLELSAIVLEIASLGFVLVVLLTGNDKLEDGENQVEASQSNLLSAMGVSDKEVSIDNKLEDNNNSSSTVLAPTTTLTASSTTTATLLPNNKKDHLDMTMNDVIIQKDTGAPMHENVINNMKMPVQYDSVNIAKVKDKASSLTGQNMDMTNKKKL